MHRPAASSQAREPVHQFGRPPPPPASHAREFGRPSPPPPQHFGAPARSPASYGAQNSQYRAPPSHFGAAATSPPQLLDPEAPYSPWEEGRFNFEEGARRRAPERRNDFFDNFPVKVDQTDPELERAVNDFAHSFESIKQVI